MMIQYHMQSSLFHIVSVYHKHTELKQPQLLTTLRPSCNGIPPSLPVTSFSWSRVDARRCTLACFAGRRRWRPTLRATKAPAMDAAAVVAVGKDEAFAWPAIQVTTQNSSSLPSLPSTWSYEYLSSPSMKQHETAYFETSRYVVILFMSVIHDKNKSKMISNQANENDTQENILLYYLMSGVMWFQLST